jgi:monoamine oxidase
MAADASVNANVHAAGEDAVTSHQITRRRFLGATSSYWVGYMDGAVRSGRRAAAEVLAAL